MSKTKRTKPVRRRAAQAQVRDRRMVASAGELTLVMPPDDDHDEPWELSLSLRPLTDNDMAELDDWLRARLLRNAFNAVRQQEDETAHPYSAAEKKALLDSASEASMAITFNSGPGARHMATVDGWARLVFQGLSQEARRSFASWQALRGAMFNELNVEAAARVVEELNAGEL